MVVRMMSARRAPYALCMWRPRLPLYMGREPASADQHGDKAALMADEKT